MSGSKVGNCIGMNMAPPVRSKGPPGGGNFLKLWVMVIIYICS